MDRGPWLHNNHKPPGRGWDLLPLTNEVWGKVMFLHLSVILGVSAQEGNGWGGVSAYWGVHPLDIHTPTRQTQPTWTPPRKTPPIHTHTHYPGRQPPPHETATEAGSMCHTGMYSCDCYAQTSDTHVPPLDLDCALLIILCDCMEADMFTVCMA